MDVRKSLILKKTLIAASVVTALGLSSATGMASGFRAAPNVNHLGRVIVNPSGNSPLTAIILRDGYDLTDVKVTVHGKGTRGVPISYSVGASSLLNYDGIPIFGMYPDYENKVTVEFKRDGQPFKDDYKILTPAITNEYIDSRSVTELPTTKVIKVAQGFEDRLYLVNTHTFTPNGSDLHWHGEKAPKELSWTAGPAGGSIPFDMAPVTFIIDSKGEYRWWLNQSATYNAREYDISKRGYLMGVKETPRGTLNFIQGQNWFEFDVLGRQLSNHALPYGYIDLSHASVEMPNGHLLLRAAKRNFRLPDGTHVLTVRDHILEVDKSGRIIDVWDLTKILDPNRDALLAALDIGAVCVNVDIDNIGKTAKLDEKTPFGDTPGVGAGRNWAHVNSISYEPKDDSIVLSLRHQGVFKIGRDKKVKWILSPTKGWSGDFSKKLLKPVNASGKAIKCDDVGHCEDNFEFVYTQHTAWWSSKGTLTVLDNGDGRYFEQPALPTDKYTRFVEYKIDDKNMTVQQVWEYGKERGASWYSPITSVVEYQADRDTMFGFGGSIDLRSPGKLTIGKLNEIDYKTKEVKLEIDVMSDKPNSTHYRALLIHPDKLFQ